MRNDTLTDVRRAKGHHATSSGISINIHDVKVVRSTLFCIKQRLNVSFVRQRFGCILPSHRERVGHERILKRTAVQVMMIIIVSWRMDRWSDEAGCLPILRHADHSSSAVKGRWHKGRWHKRTVRHEDRVIRADSADSGCTPRYRIGSEFGDYLRGYSALEWLFRVYTDINLKAE